MPKPVRLTFTKLKPYGYRPPVKLRPGKSGDARAAGLYWERKQQREMVRAYDTGSITTPLPLLSGTGTVI
jgi:hypothetical protein